MIKNRALLLADIENIYSQFDATVESKVTEKMEISLKLKFMELHYFVIYQELIMSIEFEEPYQVLTEAQNQLNIEIRQIMQKIVGTKLELKELIDLNQHLLINFDDIRSDLDEFLKLNGKTFFKTTFQIFLIQCFAFLRYSECNYCTKLFRNY